MIRDWESYVLSRRERRIVGALVCALYDPRGTGLAKGELEVSLGEIVDDVQAWLGLPHPALRTAFRMLLIAIEISPIRFGFGLRTMSGLPLDERARYLATLDASGAAAMGSWKSIVGLAYFARPIGAAEMDLVEKEPIPGALHPIGRKSRAHLHVAPDQRRAS